MRNYNLQRARLELAERLLESAEHSSEAEMRNSLSRMYYAIYHVAVTVAGTMAHGEFPNALSRIAPGLGSEFKRFHSFRERADYNPNFVRAEFGDHKSFRAQFPDLMADARRLYEELLELLKQGGDDERA